MGYGARLPTVILRNIGQRSQLQYCEIFCKEASYNMVEASSISLPSHLTAATIICTRNFANFCKFVKLTKCGLAGMEVKFQQFCIVSFQSSDTFLLAFRSWALSDSAQFISFQKEDMSWTRHSSYKSIKQTCGILGFDFGFLAQPSNYTLWFCILKSLKKVPKSPPDHTKTMHLLYWASPTNFPSLFPPQIWVCPSPSEYEYSDSDRELDKPNSGIG